MHSLGLILRRAGRSWNFAVSRAPQAIRGHAFAALQKTPSFPFDYAQPGSASLPVRTSFSSALVQPAASAQGWKPADETLLSTITFSILDTETTGFSNNDRIAEIAIKKVRGDGTTLGATWSSLVNPAPRCMGQKAAEITGLSDAILREPSVPKFATIHSRVCQEVGEGCVVVAHNAAFDQRMLANSCVAASLPQPPVLWLCSLKLARKALDQALVGPDGRMHAAMPDICRHYGVVNRDAHRASGDVEALAECFPRLLTTLQHHHNVHTWGQLQRFMGEGPTAPQTAPQRRSDCNRAATELQQEFAGEGPTAPETAPTVPVSIPAVEAVSNSLVSHVQMESWKREHLENLRRAELQTLAKAHGIKANKKSTQIIAELIALQARKQESNKPSLLECKKAPELLKLERVNVHPRDARIVLDTEMHQYFIDGLRYPGSVSALIHEYFPQFDGPAVVRGSFDKWSTNRANKYYRLIFYLRSVLALDDERCRQEIARTWDASGQSASTQGTDTHLQIKLCLNDEAHESGSPEFQQYVAWRGTRPTWQPYRAEWSVFSEAELICGQIDSLWVDDAGRYHMADWKRVPEMKMTAFRNECGFGPLKAMPNTNWGHYVLQQNVYAWMVEAHYGIKLASLWLVQLHPDLQTFKEHLLPRIDASVESIMSDRRRRVQAGELQAMDAAQMKASVPGAHASQQVDEAAQRLQQRLQQHLRFEEHQLSAMRPSVLARHLLLVDDDKYEAWSRNKEALFYPLITYVTKVWGADANVAKLQVARVCAELEGGSTEPLPESKVMEMVTSLRRVIQRLG